jgi:hypothetical protein
MSDLTPGDVVTMKSFTWSVDNQFQAELRFAKLSGGRKYAFLFLGAGSPEMPLDANKALNALGWRFMPDEGAQVELNGDEPATPDHMRRAMAKEGR